MMGMDLERLSLERAVGAGDGTFMPERIAKKLERAHLRRPKFSDSA
jgi:hypothetical protein